MKKVWRGHAALARRRFEILGVSFAVVLVMCASATGVALSDPVQEAAGVCDPIDQSDCLLPWPNDYFTTADASTATGIRPHKTGSIPGPTRPRRASGG